MVLDAGVFRHRVRAERLGPPRPPRDRPVGLAGRMARRPGRRRHRHADRHRRDGVAAPEGAAMNERLRIMTALGTALRGLGAYDGPTAIDVVFDLASQLTAGKVPKAIAAAAIVLRATDWNEERAVQAVREAARLMG